MLAEVVLAAIWRFELMDRLVLSVSLVVLVVSALVAVHRSMLAAVAHARAVRSRFAVA